MEIILPQHIDSTMRSTFVDCPQKFYDEYVLGRRPQKFSVDLHAGACFASTLETFRRRVWEQGDGPQDALIKAHGTFVREWGSFIPEKETAKTPDRVWAALEDYTKVYDPRMDHVRPLFVNGKALSEFSFSIPLLDAPAHPPSGEPFVYVGRADLIGEYQKRIVILDEKTAGRLERNWTEKWDMRAQFMGYVWAAQQAGLNCDTVIVRGIIITKKDIRQVEAIKIYPRWMIDRWYNQLLRDVERIVKCWHDDYWDYNLGNACTNYGSCPFLSVCTTHPEQRQGFLENFEVRRWNPLNRNPVSDQPSPAASPALIGPDLRTPSLESATSP